MFRHGFAIKDDRKGINHTSLKVDEGNRVIVLQQDEQLMEFLRRVLLARHRLLLTSGGVRLPKIDYNTAACEGESCPYYLQEDSTEGSACHFYCQTDRNWSCEGCKHNTTCVEHSKYHPFQVLDESNRIREALRKEIELLHNESNAYSEWSDTFTITQVGDRRLLALSNPSGFRSSQTRKSFDQS